MMSKESILIKHLIEINDWVKTDELSLFLNVSTRTIRNLIKNINVKKNIYDLLIKDILLIKNISLKFKTYVTRQMMFILQK